MKWYKVDFGDTVRIMEFKTLRYVYATQIDKAEYPHFDGWLWDMQRCGLIEEV